MFSFVQLVAFIDSVVLYDVCTINFIHILTLYILMIMDIKYYLWYIKKVSDNLLILLGCHSF